MNEPISWSYRISLGTLSLAGFATIMGALEYMYILVTDPGGSGEFTGINYFGPALMIGFVCYPLAFFGSIFGFLMGWNSFLRKKRAQSERSCRWLYTRQFSWGLRANSSISVSSDQLAHRPTQTPPI
ncbi:MAG: hypothetical protein CMJ78_07525 [Planctomycetaceae bacterium]|nr:hypothetical protein [Planctomycetaceae bacterium]